MKILLISTPPSNRGGISNWVRLLSEYVQSSQCGVKLERIETRSYKSLKHSVWEKFIVNGFDIFRIKKEVKKKCKKDRPDVIHITATGEWSTFRDIAVEKIAKQMHIPVVYHTHFGKLPQFRAADGFRWKMLKKAIGYSKSVWTIDPKTKATVDEAFPEKIVEYAPNPIVMDELPAIIPTVDNSILYLGWIVKSKGIEELLEAWQTVYAENPEYELKLVGPYDNEYMSVLKEKYDFSGVVVLGRLEHEDAMRQLAQSQIFILPSYTEGFPNVVLEAMALAKPIIATSVGAIPDMLNGNCGIIIEPHSFVAITDAIKTLISNPALREEMAENGYRKVRDEYDVDVVMKNYYNMWKKCVKEVKVEDDVI